MILTRFLLPAPLQALIRTCVPTESANKNQNNWLNPANADTLALSFGTRTRAKRDLNERRDLKEALGLSVAASEDEFQACRSVYLRERGIDQAVKTKASLTSYLGLPKNASAETIRNFLKADLATKMPDLDPEDAQFVCELIVAYPKPHPFDYGGHRLG